MAKPGLPSQREIDAVLEEQARELIALHNERYHPGQGCLGEDKDGACHLWTGKPAVLMWTDAGPVYTEAGQQWLAEDGGNG